VRRFIRDGRLPAKRIGKEYRITRSALDEFAGTPATEPSDAAIPRTRQVLVSSIVDVDAISCPMMYGPGVEFGHACMRWILKLTGGLPT
jgi:helix-turn-helix protein